MKAKIIKLYLLSILLGALTGAIGSYFILGIGWLTGLINQFTHMAGAHGWPLALTSGVVSMLLVSAAFWMVKIIAPEAAGSGVQEIEGTLLHERPIFWRRLLPVKFVAGIMSISAKMVMGREGPTIQMGGNLGEMIGEIFHIPEHRRSSFIAAGAAAGLATAFNAPLAGVLFVIEEMRNAFNFSFTNFKLVAIACVVATIVLHTIIGDAPAIKMDIFTTPSLKSLWLFCVFGIVIGFIGLLFNLCLMRVLGFMDRHRRFLSFFYAPSVGLLVGALAILAPRTVGGGYEIIEEALQISLPVQTLLLLFLIRFATTMMCYSTSVPGGIFAPMLALGTLLGLATYQLLIHFMPDMSIHPGMFAVAGMGALFAACVRAPVTGIVLVVEMTQNYLLILPIMVSCLMATTVVQLANNAPIYTQLLHRSLRLAFSGTSNHANAPD